MPLTHTDTEDIEVNEVREYSVATQKNLLHQVHRTDNAVDNIVAASAVDPSTPSLENRYTHIKAVQCTLEPLDQW